MIPLIIPPSISLDSPFNQREPLSLVAVIAWAYCLQNMYIFLLERLALGIRMLHHCHSALLLRIRRIRILGAGLLYIPSPPPQSDSIYTILRLYKNTINEGGGGGAGEDLFIFFYLWCWGGKKGDSREREAYSELKGVSHDR